MHKIREKFINLDNGTRIKYISILMIAVLVVTISLPTLARYKNRIDIENVLNSVDTWDGTVASAYHKGTGSANDPYIISNAKEFAYFQKQLQSTNYTNTYFKLENDIVINKGKFNYTTPNKITYSLEDKTLYLKEYTSDIYDNESMTGSKVSSINKFDSLNNFKGYFDGDYNTIYGLYMTSDTENELALFKNLSGTVKNLYLENTMIYGGSVTAALASTTENATIKDIFIEGNVINTKSNSEDLTILKVDNYTKEKTTTPLEDNLILPTYSKTGIKSIYLKGEYSTTAENQKIIINDKEFNPGSFTIDLGTSPLEYVQIKVNDGTSSTITLSNMTYEITYGYGISSGVVANATHTNLKNIINKANVYSSYDASGIIGTLKSSNLENAYNTGKITATTTASGLINSIKNSDNDLVVSKVYNTGELTGTTTNSFINEISNNKTVSISNVFNTSVSSNNISSISQSVVFNNVFDVNKSTVDGITPIDVADLKNKTSLITYMGYNEYIDTNNLNSNESNAWIYEKNSFPILYFDDLNKTTTNLHVGTYTWNDISYELKDIYFSKGTAFSIEQVDELNPVETYYYIHKAKSALTKEQINQITNWTKYENIVSLTEEGYYTIYVKSVDENSNINYINSEQLIIDLTSPEVKLTMNDKIWTNFRDNIAKVSISAPTNLTLTYTDKYSEIKSSKYYISKELLTKDELNEIKDWQDYSTNIPLTTKGTYIVNVRVEDERGHVTYVNSDSIMFGGYEQILSLGRNSTVSFEKVDITKNSSIRYNFKYDKETLYEEGYNSNLITNVLLPKNTYITLIDNVNNIVYSYKIKTDKDEFGYEKSCKDTTCNKFATYPLSLFTKIGQTDTNNTFEEKMYLEQNTKDLTFIMDFSNTDISNKQYIETILEIHDNKGEVILSTLKSSIQELYLYPDNEASLIIDNKSEVKSIDLNSESTTTINFESYLSNKNVDNSFIYDMKYENKKMALAIKLVDSSSNIVPKRYLKNIKFKLGDKYYSPDNDGIVRINLSNGLDKFTGELKIETYQVNSELKTGNYNFIITPFVANDGKYEKNMTNNSSITIPASTTQIEKVNYGFNVLMNDSSKIIYKKDQTTDINLKFVSVNTLTNSSIRMSLYKKKTLSAYDQTYEIVDLQDYVIGELSKVDNNIYQITNNNLNLSFNNSKFDNIGYELRFELYDSNNKITTLKKKFVVR